MDILEKLNQWLDNLGRERLEKFVFAIVFIIALIGVITFLFIWNASIDAIFNIK